MLKKDTISVLIPTFNRANYLAQTIESVLSQDHPDLEVIISDNASTDGTRELVQRYLKDPRVHYKRNERNLGLVANHKKALEYSTGGYFLVMSDDDYFVDPCYLSKASRLIKDHPDLVMVYAQGHILYEGGQTMQELLLPFREVEQGKTIFMTRGTIRPLDFMLCNVLFRTDIARSFEPFSNEQNLSGDSELFLKMCLAGRVGVIKDPATVYRVHPTSITHKIRQDPALLVHNLDHLIRPYQLAKRLKILTRDELRYWEKRVVLPEMRRTLFFSALNHKNMAGFVSSTIKAKCPNLYWRLMLNPKFCLRYRSARISRGLYYLVSGEYRREVALERERDKSPHHGTA